MAKKIDQAILETSKAVLYAEADTHGLSKKQAEAARITLSVVIRDMSAATRKSIRNTSPSGYLDWVYKQVAMGLDEVKKDADDVITLVRDIDKIDAALSSGDDIDFDGVFEVLKGLVES